MHWAALQDLLRRVATPIRQFIALYASALALFALLRLLRVSGTPALDLANTFAPYLFLPLLLTFPLSVIVTRGQAPPLSRAHKRLARPGKLPAAGTQPPRWTALLQILLIGFGLYTFALPAIYQPLPPPTGATFSLVTFNVQGSNAELQRATDWLIEAAPDLILLQETAEGYDQRLAPLYAVYAHEAHIEGSARVFSRFPIRERQAISIEDAPGRQALRLVLDQDGRELAVYALHLTLPLKPRANPDPDADIGLEALLRYDESRRNKQIQRLLALLEDEALPAIVAGDFNMSDSSLIYADIAAELSDAWRAAGSGAGRTWPQAEAIGLPRVIHPLLRIDYIWHSEELRAAAAAVGPAIGSDHLPVSAVMEWRAR